MPDQDPTAVVVQVRFGKRERLADPKAGPPEHNDQSAEAQTVRVVSGGSHHGDDLLDGRRVGRVAQTLVPWRAALVDGRECGWRAPAPSAIDQGHFLHDVLLSDVGGPADPLDARVFGRYSWGAVTTREKLHLLVDEFSDAEAEAALARLTRERDLLAQWTAPEDAQSSEDAWALSNAREAIREERW